MESNGQEGPDGSSLKSVSSLRSRFENMQKETPPTPTTPTVPQPPAPAPIPASVPAPPPPRTVSRSPSPKPPPVPNTRPSRSTVASSSQQNGPAKQRESLDIPRPQPPSFINGGTVSNRSSRIMNPPPLSPNPTKPPSVLVEPPHSPPRENNVMTPLGDPGSRLNPDLHRGPTTPITPLNRAFKIPSRPNTPGFEPRRSPKLNASQPPSPPPPRRSGEFRRDRDVKPPPPVNRAEKPSVRMSNLMENIPKLEASPRVADRRSPFSSPPGSDDEKPPPVLPARPPRPPQQQKAPAPLTRTATAPIPQSFDPPPVHHTIVNKRRDLETNEQAALSTATQLPVPRPNLPSRPQTTAELEPTRTPSSNATPKPPPRPPRPGVITSNIAIDTDLDSSQSAKRAVSNPTSQFAPPPSRTHNRSMTVDRTSDRTPAQFREPPKRIAPERDQQIDSPSPAVSTGSTQINTVYPDASKINRRSPFTKQGNHEIYTKYDTRIFDVCGQYVCTSGNLTRVWNMLDGDQLTSFSHGEGVKASAVKFKSTLDIRYESTRIWIGTNTGELMEADAATQSLVASKPNAHGRYEIIRIFRHYNEMWTLDESGTLHVWGPDSEGLPNLNNNPHQTFRLPRGHTFSMIVGEELWHATGKEIRIFHPTVDGRTQVQVLARPLISEGAGEVTSGALVKTQPGKVFFGHADGKVSVYSQSDFTCLSVLTVSNYKINALAGVGKHIWAGYNSGKICVYDVETSPWVVKKDFQAHDNPAIKIIADPSSFYYIDRLQVISLGADNVLRSWDGLLQDDFLETEMKAIDTRYCTFQDINVLAMTWNAGASTPSSLRSSKLESDSVFIQNLIQSSGTPDILIFGFQELVDLEDKTATAKRLFKSKKKDPVTAQERMSHQYRDWRDFLVRSLDDFMPAGTLYHLLHSATLVGLFTCIFVKSDIHSRIKNLSSSQIKRGMGGLHGNKGAIVVRFMVDDTSLCFINCHLAAGQSQANARHNDIKEIMEAGVFQPEIDPTVRMDSFTGGGDGSMILDHELCLLNGDLNYRIDTMSRDTVVHAVKAGNLAKLLERDQLLVARRRNPAFKLRAFEEMLIEFAPTYKYDVGTDNYDSSEKKRSPAWCDRLLHRGSGRIQQFNYLRHEVHVSDHRPVTGLFKFTVKSISPRERILAWADCQQRFEAFRQKEGQEEKLNYLMNLIGYDQATSQQLIQDKDSKKLHRSPSRHVE